MTTKTNSFSIEITDHSKEADSTFTEMVRDIIDDKST